MRIKWVTYFKFYEKISICVNYVRKIESFYLATIHDKISPRLEKVQL